MRWRARGTRKIGAGRTIDRCLLVRQDDTRFDQYDSGLCMRGQASAGSTDPDITNGARARGAHDGARTQTISFGVPGGAEAPRHARGVLSSHLRHIDRTVASDAELIISELVTNSVRHGGVGSRSRIPALALNLI